MNNDRENRGPGADSDSMVSAEYRAIATEHAPPALDSAVLAKAKVIGKGGGLRRFTALWFRPLAFVATLGLSLAMLLELTSSPDLQSVGSPAHETGRLETKSSAADPPSDALGSGDTQRSSHSPARKNQSAGSIAPAQTDSPGYESDREHRPESTPSRVNKNEPTGSPAAANAPAAYERTSADFSEMIEASSKQMRGPDGVTEVANQSLSESRSDNKERVEEVVAFGASAFMLDDAVRPCAKEQITLPRTWWQCISDLEDAGRHDEARTELALFNKVHPNFEAQKILPSQ